MPIQSTYHANSLPPWLENLYQDIGERSRAIRNEAYQPYGGNRLAPLMNPDLEQAYGLGRQSEDYLPYLLQGRQLATEGAASFPANVAQYMDPYQQQVLNTLRQESTDAFNQDFLPSMERQFVAAGQHGSTRHQDLVQRGAFDSQKALQQNMGRFLSEGYGQAGKLFNADMARKLEASGQMPGLGQAKQAGRIADIAALTEQGGAQRAHDQARLDIPYQDFMRQRAFPQEALASQAAVMGNIPSPQSSYTAQQTPGIPQLNTMGNLGALAGNLYGARMAYGRKAGGSIRKYANGGNVRPSVVADLQQRQRNVMAGNPNPALGPITPEQRAERLEAFGLGNRLSEFGRNHEFRQQPFNGISSDRMQQYNQEHLYAPEVRATMPWNQVPNFENPQAGYKKGGRPKAGLSRLPLMQGSFSRKPKPGGSLGVKRLKNRDMEMK